MPSGGKRPGAGRPRGARNKVTVDIKALAQEHGPAAIRELVALLQSKDERTRVAAIKELLDRGYGRPKQVVAGDDEGGPPIRTIQRIIVGPTDESP